jgi:nucleotide-binding universal stress UspA family protein
MGSADVLVVGVDGSPDSRLALEYAVSEAVLRGAVLRVVSAFESAGIFGDRYDVPIPVSDQQIAEKVEAEMVALINEVIGTRPDAPKVQVVVQAGVTGRVLTEASADADMLIVGHRGRGEVSSALLGSIGLYCVLHARCSVTVVRPRGELHTE